jgi:hypothetical protein
MSLNLTTLSAAIGAADTQFGLASTTGITAPVSTTGAGITFLYVDREMMAVYAVPVSGTVQVIRGVSGTQAVAHAASSGVVAGGPADFPTFQPTVASFSLGLNRYQGLAAPVASATTITASGQRFHVTGTTATATINLPPNFLEGDITIIADGVWTWTAAGNILVAGTVTTAGSSVTFSYDAATAKWYPSRLA